MKNKKKYTRSKLKNAICAFCNTSVKVKKQFIEPHGEFKGKYFYYCIGSNVGVYTKRFHNRISNI